MHKQPINHKPTESLYLGYYDGKTNTEMGFQSAEVVYLFYTPYFTVKATVLY